MTIQLSRYETRKQSGIAEYKWRKTQKHNYEHLLVVADGLAVGFGFWLFMSIIIGQSLLEIGLLTLALATALFTGQVLNDTAHSFFVSDKPKRFLTNAIDFLSKKQYLRSVGRNTEGKESQMKYVIRRAVLGIVALPLVSGAYVFIYLLLASLANDFSITLDDVWNNGLLVGTVSAIAFAFATQIEKLVSKIIA